MPATTAHAPSPVALYPPEFTPPEDVAIVFGGGDFFRVGQNIIDICIEHLDLTPDARVLDVGCGGGRAAVPLTRYLTTGSYEGFDTYPLGIKWASATITPRHPNFRFTQVDIFNSTYNPYAPTRAADFIFPYDADSFDLVILNSVFTHMMPEDVAGYMRQISRVLIPGGRAFITWFIMNDAAHEAVANGTAHIDLRHRFGSFYTADLADPEDAVGYAPTLVSALYADNGLTLRTIHHGRWKGTTTAHGALHFQDVALAVNE